MEYCPEIAVLHSAFALISKQARAQLKLINKYEAKSYCSIITAAVREITAGLQSDLYLADSDAWHQKLHTLIQYKLIKSQNTEKDAATEETEMLVYSNFDMLAAILPEFSGPFYFELVKDNNWYQHFFQSLLLHEASIGGSLLEHALEHCQSKPVDIYDRCFISAMMDFVVSAVLSVPAELSPIVLSAVKLKPVCSQSSLFMEFLHERKHFIADIVNFQCEAATYYKSKSHQRQYLKCLGQLMFLGIVGILWKDEKESLSLWIVRNLLKRDSCRPLVPKDEVGHSMELHAKCADVERLDSDRYSVSSEDRGKEVGHIKLGTDIVDIPNRNYVLHTTLTDLLSEDFPTNVWTYSLCKCLMLSEVSDINALNLSDIYQGLSDVINEPMIWITDSLYIETGKVMNVMSGVIIKISVGQTSGVEGKNIFRVEPSPLDTDLTIGALMWRIHEKLFFYKGSKKELTVCCQSGLFTTMVYSNCLTSEVTINTKELDVADCLQLLVSPECFSFWNDESVAEFLQWHIDILGTKPIVLRLLDINRNFHGQQPKLQQLILKVFDSLSVELRDELIASEYTKHDRVPWLQGETTLDIISIFNRITSRLDTKVLDEVLRLALQDTRKVLMIVVEMSVKNTEQAMNMSSLLRQLPSLCLTRHPLHHPDMSLLTVILENFLVKTSLSKSEDQRFLLFLQALLQSEWISQAQPDIATSQSRDTFQTEFLSHCVLPHINSASLYGLEQPVTCNLALRLLRITLESYSARKLTPDWMNIQPIAMVTCICEVLHECLVVWRGAVENLPVSSVALKGLAVSCLHVLIQLIVDSGYPLIEREVIWLRTRLEGLDWLVTVYARKVLCNNAEDLVEEYLKEMKTGHLVSSHCLLCILRLGSVDEETLRMTKDAFIKGYFGAISYEDIIISLCQVAPHLLVEEFGHVLDLIRFLALEGILDVPYRASCVYILPLEDFSGVKGDLCVSQLLRDMVISYCLLWKNTALYEHELNYLSQSYVAAMQTKIETCKGQQNLSLQMFVFSQFFIHACSIMATVPNSTSEYIHVLVLHLLGVAQDLCANEKVMSALNNNSVKSFEQCVKQSIQVLPAEYRNFMIEKLNI